MRRRGLVRCASLPTRRAVCRIGNRAWRFPHECFYLLISGSLVRVQHPEPFENPDRIGVFSLGRQDDRPNQRLRRLEPNRSFSERSSTEGS
jgi:hypothetical protein